MKRLLRAFMFLSWIALALGPGQAAQNAFRPPAVPLVAVDPYLSIWSFADHLTYDATRHWTGERITLTFLTPDLPKDIDVLARPITYLSWGVRSTDGKDHQVSIFYDNTAELVVNTPDEKVVWSAVSAPNLRALRMGTADQPILKQAGDRIRIDWGYLYVAAPQSELAQDVVLDARAAIHAFTSTGILPSTSDTRMPRSANDHWPVIAFAFNLGNVGRSPTSRHLILAYDEIDPIEYFHTRLRPYWQYEGAT